jgi:mono/diheme cytochrome c family protein
VLPVDIALSNGQLAAVAAGEGHTPGAPRLQTLSADVATQNSGCNTFGAGAVDSTNAQTIAVAVYNGTFITQSRQPAQINFNDGVTMVTLSDDSVEDTGHAVFHSDSSAGLACASCHLEGGEDGHTWTFDNSGPRRTQSIRGGILGTEPFHWDGDQPDFNAIIGNVFEHRMAGPALADDQSFALRSWVNTIPAMPQRTIPDAAAVARGQALFHDAQNVGCVSCHAGTILTDNATVDVGTGGSFQVPSLRGVVWRAPYLHDGRAATLADRFGPNGGGDQHGVTSKLSADQISDLVAYLQTL